MFEGLQRGRADVMLDPLRIAFRSLFVDSQAEEKRDDDPVSSAAGLGQLPTGIREEYGAVRFPPHQASGSGQNMGVMRRVFCLRRSADHRELRPL